MSTLRAAVEEEARAAHIGDPLRQMRISEIRIDINERCNLRCDYCAVSAPSYHGVEMPASVFDRVLPLLQREKDAAVYVNGHGETTYHRDWQAWCRRILDAGHRPIITTNLAKPFSDDEIALLARFRTIQVSLDSHDAGMMKRVRKAVDVDKVFATMERIREAAARGGSPDVPEFSMSVGVYDPSVWTLEAFVERLIAINVAAITFWNLVEKPHQVQVKALCRLEEPMRQRAREILSNVRSRLEREAIPHEFAGDFDAMLPLR
ncbi:radical SAM protein [Endothiovibrio diazotrophicus]